LKRNSRLAPFKPGDLHVQGPRLLSIAVELGRMALAPQERETLAGCDQFFPVPGKAGWVFSRFQLAPPISNFSSKARIL
jgi:hypothetical protein